MKSDLSSGQLSLKDVIMSTSIQNGRASVAPFNVQIGSQNAMVGGSIGVDGTLDYRINTEVDAGMIGQQVNQLMAGLTGNQAAAGSSKIKLNFGVGGTYDKPLINLLGTTSADGTTTTVKQEAQQQVQQQAEALKQEAEAKVQAEAQKVMTEAEKQFQQQADTLKKEVTKTLQDEAGKAIGDQMDSTSTQIKESLKNIFKKKKTN